MRQQFSLFQSHLDMAHSYWKRLICPGDRVIDATCGNGHDSLFLAQCCLSSTSGDLACIDLQEVAIEKTKIVLSQQLSPQIFSRIEFYKQCHSFFPKHLDKVKLIVYNLGYLPQGEKSITTKSKSTLLSIESALNLLIPGGALSITCYPGHPEGKNEEDSVLKLISSLNPQKWSCCHHIWKNRLAAPSLIFIQKSLS